MRKLILSAGHTNVPGKDRGASATIDGKTWYEGDEAARIVADLYPILIRNNVDVYVDDYKNALADTLATIKRVFGSKLRQDTLAVEIHFNASQNPEVGGSEVIIPQSATGYEKQAAEYTLGAICSALKTKSRGVRDESETFRKRLGWMRIPCETILIEVCFMTSKQDMAKYETSYRAMVSSLAAAIVSTLSK